ncbi:hypothetical protein F4604DRAFT_1930349 [Suillus subluteus]|nr:hypothetical protein F4604DRAFT_1930349 [Suillus subluteus]
MARRGDNFILADDPEIHPNPQNLATALIVIGRTTCNFITRGTHVSQGPTVPEHRANIENRLNTSLAYRPYRPYTSFTPHNENEGRSGHSPHCVSNFAPISPQSNLTSLQSTTLAGSSCGHTESLSPPATAPTGHPSIPIASLDTSTSLAPPATVSFMPTGHPSIPIASLDTSTALIHPSSPITAQVTTPDTSLNDAPMDDASMDNELPSDANRENFMDQDMPTTAPLPPIDPVTHPKPTSDIPTGSGRHKALPLASIPENYLGQLVNQQFAQLSDKVVVPALRSAVDTMIPTIIEQITDEIKGIHSTCSHTIPPALMHPRKYRGTSEEDSEPDCDDDLTPSPRRKHPGKRGIKNQLHHSFRKYLQDKHLLISKTGSLPQSPPLQVVQAFTDNNENPPSLDNIAIDWQDSLRSSLGNTEAINLMVVDFQQKIQTGSYPSVKFNDDTMNLDDLRIEAFADVQEREEATHEQSCCSIQRQRLDRLNTCKHGTLERCRKIVEQNRHHNPQNWDMIKHIIDWLDVDGMSGDETDTAIGVKLKIVRCVALPWISPAITDLLHMVESYAPTTYEENMSVPIGNTSLPRYMEARCTSKNSIAITRLPRNWYNDAWYKVNTSGIWALLHVHKDFEVPCLDVYHSVNDVRR